MPVSAAYQHTIPAPYTGSFTHGEMAVSGSATIDGATGNSTYYLSRMFNFDGGVYVLKSVVQDHATWWAGIGGAQRLIHSNAIADGVTQVEVYIEPGVQRLDLILQNTSVGASSCYAAFSLFKDDMLIYSSAASGWVYDVGTPIPDASVPAAADPRLALPVFSLLPNWAQPVSETIGWLTDILSGENGAEQRRALREHPRRTFEATFQREGVGRERLDAFLVHVGSADCMIPLWHEQYRVPVAITSGSTYVQFPTGTLALREFQVGDLVFINAGDAAEYLILKVGAVDTALDQLVWVTPPAVTWPAGSRVMPMRRAYVLDTPQMANPIDRVGTSRVRFQLRDPDTRFTASWGYSAPLFRFKVSRAESITLSYDRTTYMIDNEVGPSVITDPGGRAHIGTRVSLQIKGRQEVVTLREFLLAARGRAVRFWCPSHMQDIEPSSALGGTTFEAKRAGVSRYMKKMQWARIFIGIVLADGSPTIYRKITNVTEVGGVEVFTVDESLPPVLVESIERIQFIVPSRFDQDTVELVHLVDESAVVTTSLITRSVDGNSLEELT